MYNKEKLIEQYNEFNISGNKTEYRMGNDVLYKMCEAYPHHDDIDVIASKIWLIGRSYAATIERGRKNTSNIQNDDFYYQKVAPAFLESKVLDRKLDELKAKAGDYIDHLEEVLSLHKTILDICKSIDGLQEVTKRSFASKYLHFHCPQKALIYDSRAAESIRKIEKRIVPKDWTTKYDAEYADFCARVKNIADCIKGEDGQRPSPRQIDNFLLYYIEKH